GLGIDPEPTDRIRHVAHLGVRTLGFAFAAHGLEPPTAPVRVELTAPSGAAWEWGPAEAADRVSGPAYDFCLRVTQRRHRDDLDLVAEGAVADQWLDVAQAFAGPPGQGRQPR
ncbi:MAG: wyosine base formation domain-containing protein, partial [Marmoricola sp.]|nr:wyosine base formation domain-containing protein [Marmoricola sp.]